MPDLAIGKVARGRGKRQMEKGEERSRKMDGKNKKSKYGNWHWPGIRKALRIIEKLSRFGTHSLSEARTQLSRLCKVHHCRAFRGFRVGLSPASREHRS